MNFIHKISFSLKEIFRHSRKPSPRPEANLPAAPAPLYLQESWSKTIQHLQKTTDKPRSAFEHERKLLRSMFPYDLPHSSTFVTFIKTLTSNAMAGKGINEVNSNLNHSEPISIEIAKEQIAKIIFLADRDPEETAKLLNTDNITTSLKNIDVVFNEEVDKILRSRDEMRKKHQEYPLQNATLAVNIYTPIAIAKMLLTSKGTINLGLKEIVKSRFFNISPSMTKKEICETLSQHDQDLSQTLDDLTKFPNLITTIESIKKPENPYLCSNDIIRTTLKLAPNAKPTDSQTKIVALAGLLSDMRQSDVGTCFATSVGIMMMGALKEKVISDFSEILTKGKISRPSAADQSEFVPVLDIGDATCQQNFVVNSLGQLLISNNKNSKIKLWDSPGLISACRQQNLYGEKAQKAILEAVEELFKKKKTVLNATIELSMENLITEIVLKESTGHKLSARHKEEQINLALTAFNSEINCSLLRAWESCLAAMAEAGTSGYVRKKIKNCVDMALRKQWPKKFFFGSQMTKEAILTNDVFQKVFDSGLQIRYDAKEEIKNSGSKSKTTDDGHSTSTGAFVIYELNKGDGTISSKRIVTPEDFNAFVLRRMKITQEIMNKFGTNDNERKRYQVVLEKIINFIERVKKNFYEFLRKCINFYDPENKKISDPINNWEKMEHLPFRDASGDYNVPIYNKATGIDAGKSFVV